MPDHVTSTPGTTSTTRGTGTGTDEGERSLLDALRAAERADRELREQVNHLAHARSHAASQVSRLGAQADAASGATADELRAIADRYARRTEVLDTEITAIRGLLDAQRLTIEHLRAEVAGA